MRWPWVSRADHDRVVAELAAINRRTLDALTVTTERLFAANESAMAKYHELAMPKAPALYPAVEPKPPDPITKVIREQAGRDPVLLEHFRKYARELKAQGLTEDQIVGKLIAWQTSELAEGSV